MGIFLEKMSVEHKHKECVAVASTEEVDDVQLICCKRFLSREQFTSGIKHAAGNYFNIIHNV